MATEIIQTIDPTRSHGFESVASDRLYSSTLFTEIHAGFTHGGFSESYGEDLDFVITGTQTAQILTGAAMIYGHYFLLDAPQPITIDAESAGNERYDIIAVRVNRNTAERNIQIIKIVGTSNAIGTAIIPYTELMDEDLTSTSGIKDFPIHIVRQESNESLADENVIKTLGSEKDGYPCIFDRQLSTTAISKFRVFVPVVETEGIQTIKIRIQDLAKSDITNEEGVARASLFFNNFKNNSNPITRKIMNKTRNNQILGRHVFHTLTPIVNTSSVYNTALNEVEISQFEETLEMQVISDTEIVKLTKTFMVQNKINPTSRTSWALDRDWPTDKNPHCLARVIEIYDGATYIRRIGLSTPLISLSPSIERPSDDFFSNITFEGMNIDLIGSSSSTRYIGFHLSLEKTATTTTNSRSSDYLVSATGRQQTISNTFEAYLQTYE